jgi:hypothetical protein
MESPIVSLVNCTPGETYANTGQPDARVEVRLVIPYASS